MKKILALLTSILIMFCSLSLLGCRYSDFTVIFDGNGGKQVSGDTTSLEQTVSDASELIEPKFERAGYEFNGWSVALSDIEEDTTVKAEWKKSKLTVSFDKNGGEWGQGFDDNYIVSAYFGKKITDEFPVVTRAGYKFEKWIIIEDDELNGQYFSPEAEYQYNKSIKVQAQWTTDAYVIKYNDASFGDNVNVKTSFGSDEESFELPTPIKIGFTFDGWTGEGITNPQLTVTVNPSVAKDLEFTANWQAKQYTITLNENGGNCDKQSVTAIFGQAIELPTPTWENKIFEGWKYGSITIENGYVWDIDEEVELVAEWNENLAIKLESQYYHKFDYKGQQYERTIELSISKTEGYKIKIGGVFKNDTLVTPKIKGQNEFRVEERLAHEYVWDKSSYWAYKDAGGNLIKIIQDQTVATVDMAIDGVITLYPVCSMYGIYGPY